MAKNNELFILEIERRRLYEFLGISLEMYEK